MAFLSTPDLRKLQDIAQRLLNAATTDDAKVDAMTAQIILTTVSDGLADPALRELANDQYGTDDVEIDDEPATAPADEGTWVAAWVWIAQPARWAVQPQKDWNEGDPDADGTRVDPCDEAEATSWGVFDVSDGSDLVEDYPTREAAEAAVAALEAGDPLPDPVWSEGCATCAASIETRAAPCDECGHNDQDDSDDDGCPVGDPDCLGDNGDCHDACEAPQSGPYQFGSAADLVARARDALNGGEA